MDCVTEILRSTPELEALVPEWIALWRDDPGATPFQHPAWLVPWWHHFGQPDLRVLTMRDGESHRLLAIVPMYVYREPGSGERQFLLLGAGTSDYLDGVFAPGLGADKLVRAIGDLLAEGIWDVAHWTQLRPGSPLLRAIEALPGAAAQPYPGEPTSRCPATPIAGLPAKVRREVLFCRNAAIAHGRLELTAAGGATISPAFDHLVTTHTERWRQAGESGVLADPPVLAWHREALPLLDAAGLLRLMTLRLGGEPLATLYSLTDGASRPNRTQYFYLMGFDLAHADLQPGRLLTAYAVEHAAGEGVQIIDMLRGDETYKRFWHAERVATHGFALRHETP